IDLQRFPRLRIDATSQVPVAIGVVVRTHLDSGQLASASATLVPGHRNIEIDLSRVRWADNRASLPAPQRAAMLRLRVQLARGQLVHVHAVTLDRIRGFQPILLANSPRLLDIGSAPDAGMLPVYRVPQAADEPALQAIGKQVDVHAGMVMDLPQNGRVEQQLQQRDRILEAVPAAILVPQRAFSSTIAQARVQVDSANATKTRHPWKWIALGLYALLLGASLLWPCTRTRLRALIEVILVLLGPLWLIAGENFTGTNDPWQYLLIGASMIYALSLYRPGIWNWNGSANAWILAAAIVVAAAVVGVVMHRSDSGFRAISTAHVVRYVAWALVQQYLVCAICTQRWRIVSGSSMIAVYLGALGFALLHTPNATLMLATFCAGACWCALYLRERALLPLAVSHAASALLLMTLLPPEILRSAEVSARFFS
ncbi:MAG TPA: CPBP family intramembrane glutamic endopeptidase, partial [Rudaea sp.]|nr:CPBP family intramembrane glutamic endopeptidase [Rudaea sp.]